MKKKPKIAVENGRNGVKINHQEIEIGFLKKESDLEAGDL
jgi:hypothetical protein